MIKIENFIVEPNAELPDWWKGGNRVRIISKDGTSFFIYHNDDPEKAHAEIQENRSLDIKGKSKDHRRQPPDGYYDVMIHSTVCVRLIFNRGLDVSPEEDVEIEDIEIESIDPRTASVYDINYWFFRQAQRALKDKAIPRGFQEAIKVMRDSYDEMRLERKGITQRKMETREIVVEDDDED